MLLRRPTLLLQRKTVRRTSPYSTVKRTNRIALAVSFEHENWQQIFCFLLDNAVAAPASSPGDRPCKEFLLCVPDADHPGLRAREILASANAKRSPTRDAPGCLRKRPRLS